MNVGWSKYNYLYTFSYDKKDLNKEVCNCHENCECGDNCECNSENKCSDECNCNSTSELEDKVNELYEKRERLKNQFESNGVSDLFKNQ